MRTFQFILVFFTLFSFGQKQANIWYFGDKAGLDFNSGTPTAILNGQLTFPSGQNHNEGTSAISDSSGTILFYSDGMTIWNRNHLIMQNGNGLLGNFSSTQSSIIVPQPGQPDRYYYIFTIGSMLTGPVGGGFRYSKIDMCLDGGLGGVITTQKNIKLLDTVTEKIAVTRHSNGIDYWVLTHKFNSNRFFAMRLTSSGIVDTVISAIGSIHPSTFNTWVQGQMKFSPNGQKLAVGGSGGLKLLELFNFNKTTGVVSNSMALSRIDNGDVYGVEFSPDGSKLYTQSSSYTPFGLDFAQYDLSSGNLITINASLNSLYHNPSPSSSLLIGLQIATNGKIYMISNGNYGYLSVINNPNNYGTSCNYQAQAVYLGGKLGSLSLPSFIAGFDYSNKMVSCCAPFTLTTTSTASILCKGKSATIFATGAATYSWSTGTSGSSITVTPSTTTNYTLIGFGNDLCSTKTVFTQSVASCAGIISSENIDFQVQVFPNPFSSETIIKIASANETATLYLINSLGQTIKQIKNVNGPTISLQRDNLPNGLYYLILTQDNKTFVKKLVISAD